MATVVLKTEASHPDLEHALAELERTWDEYRRAWRNQLEKAVENGKWVAKAQALCFAHGKPFVAWMRSKGIPSSTAYDNLNLASVWDQAQVIMKASGMEVELKTASELYTFVTGTPDKPTKRKQPVEANASVGDDQSAQLDRPHIPDIATDLKLADVEPDVGQTSQGSDKKKESKSARKQQTKLRKQDEAKEEAVKSHISALYDKAAVRVLHAKRNQTIQVEFTDEIVVIIPV